ncbi:MAG TPA: RIP metalloprotease RseP [Bacteroidales bacterium]|nr:RIP metalloprotease RseP [Bacteroidales bacterium]
MVILIKIIQLIASLSLLVLVHEMGHFIAAKLFKTKVEKFYLFFNPWFSLYKRKIKDTEYGIGWLPLGGYVKIAGMIDESLDTEQLKKEPQPWEFRSKKAWQRLIIMIAGITMNLFLAIILYIIILFVWGEQYLPTTNVKYGITCDSIAQQTGLKNGDKIISIDNRYVENFFQIPVEIVLNNAKSIQVNRNDTLINIAIPENVIPKLLKNKSSDFISIRFPFEVGGFAKESPAKTAGIQEGDKLISINGKNLMYFDEFKAELSNYKNQEVEIGLIRNNDTIIKRVKVTEQGLIGVRPKSLDNYFEFAYKNYNLAEAIPAGIIKAYKSTGNYLKQLKLIFSPQTKAYESIGGFIAIGSIFPSEWHWQSFWTLTAFLSIILAIMNLLPIPALDGGHVLFLTFEIITGRKPSDKFMEYAQIIGMIILFSLLIFANANDIIKLFK